VLLFLVPACAGFACLPSLPFSFIHRLDTRSSPASVRGPIGLASTYACTLPTLIACQMILPGTRGIPSLSSAHISTHDEVTNLLQGPSTNLTKSLPESMTFFLTCPKNPTNALSLPPSCSSTSFNQVAIRFEKSVED